MPKGVKHMTKAERDECIRLYLDEKVTRLALAERFGRSIETIGRLIKKRDAHRERYYGSPIITTTDAAAADLLRGDAAPAAYSDRP